MLVISAFCCLGALAAAAYAALLAYNAKLYLSQYAARAAALHLARSAAIVAAFVGFALLGSRALLAALAGFACVHLALLAALRRSA